MATHLEKGTEGESIARDYLEQEGYKILEQNWRCRHLEIDLIAMDGDLLCVIEVKTRSNVVFGEPYTSVTPAKQGKLIQAANHFVRMNGYTNEIRFDVVSVVTNSTGSRVEVLKDAFYVRMRKR